MVRAGANGMAKCIGNVIANGMVNGLTSGRANTRANIRANSQISGPLAGPMAGPMGGVMFFLLRDFSCQYLLTNTIIPILFSKRFTRKRRFK